MPSPSKPRRIAIPVLHAAGRRIGEPLNDVSSIYTTVIITRFLRSHDELHGVRHSQQWPSSHLVPARLPGSPTVAGLGGCNCTHPVNLRAT